MSLRPQTIRADTLDLQDTDAPSAKDHTNQPNGHPNPLGAGPAAPHQEAELRHLAHDRQIEEHQLADSYYNYDDTRDASTTDIRSRAGTPYHDGHGDGEGELVDGQEEDGTDEDLMDDKISSSPSIDEDDINFDFVYALHNFIATVEGQANATKGDTMVLLDDSNSYWWLVRIIKDSSIGYLPAEHIETPTERLARLNKHKNIDLSATMLSDTTEKSKNPLKKAMRRRNAKTVTFNPPTYFEAAEVDWSEVEAEDGENDEVVDTSRNGGQVERENGSVNGNATPESDGQSTAASATASVTSQAVDKNGISNRDAAAVRSRNIEIRHTDSFLGDDKSEPKKISLTPDLLREETPGRSSESSQNGAVTQDMFDNLGRTSPGPGQTRKAAVTPKEKKPGMLSGLFKRKEKKLKIDEVAGAPTLKHEDASPTQSPTDSGRSSPSIWSQQKTGTTTTRQPSKLVKAPPPSSATPASSILKPQQQQQQQPQEKILSLRTRSSNTGINKPASSSPVEMRTVSALGRAMSPEPAQQRVLSPEPGLTSSIEPHQRIMSPEPPERVLSPEPTLPNGAATLASRNAFAGPTSIFGNMAPPTRAAPTPMSAAALAAGPASTPLPPSEAPPAAPVPQESTLSSGQSYDRNMFSTEAQAANEPTHFAPSMIAEAPVKTSMDSYGTIPSLANTSSTDTLANTPAPPELGLTNAAQTAISTTTATAPRPQTPENQEPLLEWDDRALLNYLDTDSTNDVRDMLLIVQDKTGVVPLAQDHPDMLELGFEEQRKKLEAMERELDGLLQGFLARREGRIL